MQNYLLVIVQGLFGLICLTMPGIALLSLANRRRMPAWPFAFILAASYALSSILVAGLQFLSLTLLNPMASRLVAWMFVLATLFYTCRTGWKSALEASSQVGIWERCSIAVVVAMVLFWLLLMPLSPYPSQITVDLGDPPNYYRTATNLVSGRGWEAGYFIGDYVGGIMSYVAAQPILVLITAFFFQIFGTNWYSLYVYDAIAAGVLTYLVVSFACLRPGATMIGGRRILFLTVALALVPTHFLLFGLGVVTAPAALMFLVAVVFCIANLAPAAPRYLIIVVSVIFLLWVRPEASLLAVLLVICYGVPKLLATRRISRAIRSILLVCCLVALVVLWANLPTVVNAFPPTLRGLSILYLKFDAASGRFVPMYKPWSELNYQLSRVNFLAQGAMEELGNPSIGLELRAHPVAFLRYLLRSFPYIAFMFMRAIGFPALVLNSIPALAILGTLLVLVFAAIEARSRPIVVVIVGFLLLIVTLNVGARERHILPVAPTIIGLSLRPVLRRSVADLKRLRKMAAAFGVEVVVLGVAIITEKSYEESYRASVESWAELRVWSLERMKAYHRQLGGLSLIVGIGVIGLAIFADVLGLGGQVDFGSKQIPTAAVGAGVVVLGVAILTERSYRALVEPYSFRQWLVLVGVSLVVFLIVWDSLLLISVRTASANQSYTSILKDIEEVTSPSDVIASSYPQLITCMTGRRSIGATWLTENIELMVRKYEPDFILVDNARNEDYTLLGEKNDWTVPGYVPVVHNVTQRYILFRSLHYDARQNKD